MKRILHLPILAVAVSLPVVFGGRIRPWRILVAAMLLDAAPAVADSTWDIIVSFGLPGRWATDCRSPESHANPHLVCSQAPDGTPMITTLWGKISEVIPTVVESARRLDGDKIELRERARNGPMTDLIVQVDGNRRRTLQSTRADGKVFAKDGVFTANGKETPWL